jgi:hypothetical protein
MSNKNIFIALMVAGGGLVAYALWKKKQKKSTLNMTPGWKPGDDIAVTTSDDGDLMQVKMPKMSQKDLLAQYGINT